MTAILQQALAALERQASTISSMELRHNLVDWHLQPLRDEVAAACSGLRKAIAGKAPAAPCDLCGADEAFTGTCGGGRQNPRALCFEGAAPAAPAVDAETLLRAARYVWLREQHWHESDIAVVRQPKEAIKPGYDCPSGDRLDEFCDAGIAAQAAAKEGPAA